VVSEAEFFGLKKEEDEEEPSLVPVPALQDSVSMSAKDFFGDGEVTIPQNVDKSFLERVNEDLGKRAKMLKEIFLATEAGEQRFAEGVLQVAGKVGAGAIFDFIGEALVSGARGLRERAPVTENQVTGIPIIDRPIAAGYEFLNTDVGLAGLKAAELGIGAWEEFKSESPRSARNIEAVVNIALLVTPVRAKPKAPPIPGQVVKETPLGTVGTGLVAKGREQKVADKKSFVETLILPKESAATKIEQTARTEISGLGTKKVQLSAVEREMAEVVLDVEKISASKTIQGNLNVIDEAVSKEAATLKGALKENEVTFTRQEFNEQLDAALVRLADNPLIVGDAEKTAKRIVVKMNQLTKDNPSTGSGLLQARKELDRWMLSQKGPNVFDPKLENAMTIALREVRQTTNNFIAQKATAVNVKESLSTQSTLLRAMDNIKPKAAVEGKNAAIRAWQNVSQILPLRGEFPAESSPSK